MTPADPARPVVDRRRFLLLGGGAVVCAACSSSGADSTPAATTAVSDSPPGPTSSSADAEGSATTTTSDVAVDTSEVPADEASGDLARLAPADFEALGVCTLLAATAAGPFPTIEQLDRRDVTEGHDGHPVRLGLRVIDAACSPIPGAVVEIWHADATGDYSAFTDHGGGKDEAEGSTFLRGFQTAADDGIVEFHTIYPGWYRGRAVHIHLRVHVDGREQLTSQLFFDDAYTAAVYAAPPYAEFGPADTPNSADRIAGDALTSGGLLTLTAGLTATGAGTVALTNLGVAL